MSSNKIFLISFMIAFFIVGIIIKAKADSVYVIENTEISRLQAYKIEGDSLIYQTDYICENDPIGLTGAVGLALDNSTEGQFLFVTFEGMNEIELVNAKSMRYVDTVDAPQANNLAGIIVDQERSKLYVIRRTTNYLYSYTWDRINKKLTLDLPEPYYVELEDCYQGYGLAYDEENDRLFVGDNTTTVKYYDPNDWSKLGEFEVLHTAVGIAVDVENQYVYTGSSQFGNNNFLCRHALNATDPCDVNIKVDVESPVLGITVDQDTSLVYLTTYGSGEDIYYPPPSTKDRLMVYAPYDPNNPEDPNMTLMWKSNDIGNPAGVAVTNGVSYKPPLLPLTKTDDVADPNGCVASEDVIIYSICFDPNKAYENVWLTDYLPPEVDLLWLVWSNLLSL